MRIILCSPYLTEKMERLLPDSSPAAGKFLRNLKNGLIKAGSDVIVLSYQSIAVPSTVSHDLEQEIETRKNENEFYIFKHGNILKSVSQYRSMIMNAASKGDVIMFYNSSYATLLMQRGLHRMGAKATLILADFTEQEEQRSIPRKVLGYISKLDLTQYDKYVFLSCGFMEKLGNPFNRILVQGGIDDRILYRFCKPEKDDVLNFYYAGLLSEENGIINMILAFRQIEDPNVRLIISGKGPLERRVICESRLDTRIKYEGYVDNIGYYKFLDSAHILINPRNMELSQNKNNFPSKIMEYIASGRVIISTKFPSWEGFKENIEFCESDIQSLNEAMVYTLGKYGEMCEKQYELNIVKAREFSWTAQAKRIEDLVGR